MVRISKLFSTTFELNIEGNQRHFLGQKGIGFFLGSLNEKQPEASRGERVSQTTDPGTCVHLKEV